MSTNEDWIKNIDIEDLDEPYYSLAKNMGIEIAIKIAKIFQGSQIYFPKLEKACSPKRKELIKKEFNGYNFAELAKKYGYTERWIREICTDMVSKERNKPIDNQLSLFNQSE